MTIQEMPVKNFLIKADRLDPIHVYLEEFSANQAMITVVCYGKSWSHYWGSMGSDIFRFFCSADDWYIVDKFIEDVRETDYEEIAKVAGIDDELRPETMISFYGDEIKSAYGDEWYMDLPTKISSDALYLQRIVQAIKAEFKEMISD